MSLEFQSMDHVDLPEGVPEGDSQQVMLDMQKEINAFIYPIVFKNLRLHLTLGSERLIPTNSEEMTPDEIETLTKEYLLAIMRECAETLDMINSKPWKNSRNEINPREIMFELIDIHKFLNSLYDIWGMTKEDILKYYIGKHQEVMRRIKNGY